MSSKKDEVQKNIAKAFTLIREVAAHPERFPDRFIAIPLDAGTLAPLFTPERIRLLKTLRKEGPFGSVRDLAAALHRDQTRVGRDLDELVNVGLAEVERKGKAKIVSAPNRPIVLA